MSIRVVESQIKLDEIKEIAGGLGDMVKAVVDVEKGVMAVGGAMHADAEKVLLEKGSNQDGLWGINIYPDRKGEEVVEFQSLINIRPGQGNRSMVVEDSGLRNDIKKVFDLLVVR